MGSKIIRVILYFFFQDFELQKLEKRKWIGPEVVEEVENTYIPSLNLPVPSKSSAINILQIHKSKKNFLQILGLKSVTMKEKKGKMSYS